jgi:Zn-dependent M28 family amino/carboxypeptidase
VYPLSKTVANLTLDVLQTAGLSRDVLLVGAGQSDLEDDLARAARKQDRTITPETLPERGLFYRADHFSLARQGVPVLLLMALSGAPDLREGGRPAGEKWLTDYMRCYHQTCDAWDASWDLRGAAQDVELFHAMASDLAIHAAGHSGARTLNSTPFENAVVGNVEPCKFAVERIERVFTATVCAWRQIQISSAAHAK